MTTAPQRRPHRRPGRLMLSLLLLAAVVATGLTGARADGAPVAKPAYATIEGSGSTWSSVILQQWIGDVSSSGMQISFNATGSSQGRKDFAAGVTDFGVSEIPYGNDPSAGQSDSSSRPYAYLPIVAGGTSFTYHVEVAGRNVTTLRLSGETIAKIFTGGITNWNDPEITADNNGHALPSIPIHPVVRADASGTTAQFTRYLATEYPSIWAPFNHGSDTLTSQYPPPPNSVRASGSDSVMNTITSANGNGTIGYVEYAYPLNAHYPVVKVENKAGYFVEPTQYNVAVALTQAKINNDKSSQDYLTQVLDKVYTYSDPRTYPLSSYSYMIIPTSKADSRMTSSKRQTLADFLTYSLCSGQAKAGAYGYSPLPLNLVSAGFSQVQKLKQADPAIDVTQSNVTKCNNPTFVAGNLAANHLAQVAPQPEACDKTGAGPCGTPTGTGGPAPDPGTTDPSGVPTTGSSGSPGSTTDPGTTGPGTTAPGTSGDPGSDPGTGTATGPGTSGAPVAGSTPSIDPLTGAVTTTSAQTGSSGDVYANPVDLSADRQGGSGAIGVVAALELLAIVLVPGLYVAYLRRRRGGA